MYLAPVIDRILESKKSKLIGRSSYFYITSLLNRAFSKVEPFKFRYETYNDYGREDFSVSGLFDMETSTRHIILNFPKSCKYFKMDNARWNEFKFAVSQVCQHEAIHKDQWMHRTYVSTEYEEPDFRNLVTNVGEDKDYLSDIDEIDAYGHDIAMEIRYSYPKKDPYEILRTISSRKKIWSYSYYKKTFKGDDWEHIKKRLLKKTFLWLPHVKI